MPEVFLTPCAFEKPAYHAPVSAWIEHIPFAFALMEALRPRVLVELGTHYGASYCAFCQVVAKLELNTICHAVDTWQGDSHAGHYDNDVLAHLKSYHDSRYNRFSTLHQLSFDRALEKFPNNSVDLLHIDGLHTYDAVRHDFDSWLPKLSETGVVLLHDISEKREDFGVWKLWQELRDRYDTFEFEHGHGLGVIAAGTKLPVALHGFFNLAPQGITNTRELFARLGLAVAAEQENRLLDEELTAAKISIDRAQDKITRIQRSLSWRITTPLRAIRRFIARFK